jgi:hypothetical protein
MQSIPAREIEQMLDDSLEMTYPYIKPGAKKKSGISQHPKPGYSREQRALSGATSGIAIILPSPVI